jgi:hypothetical protein
LRTNAFAVTRDWMLGLMISPVRRKADAYRLESGSTSFTSQALRTGHRVVVVGANGSAYDPGDWDLSMCFWQGRQQNLIVADNQTETYRRAPPELRRLLSQLAWGQRAQLDRDEP